MNNIEYISDDLKPIVANLPKGIFAEMVSYAQGYIDVCLDDKGKDSDVPIKRILFGFVSLKVKETNLDKKVDMNLYAPFVKKAMANFTKDVKDMNHLKELLVKYVWYCLMGQVFTHFSLKKLDLPADSYTRSIFRSIDENRSINYVVSDIKSYQKIMRGFSA